MNGRTSSNLGNTHPSMVPHNVYRCSGEDRWVAIACRTDEEWQSLVEVMGKPEWKTDSRFKDMPTRHQNREVLDQLISQWTQDKDNWWVMNELQKANVPSGIVADEADSFADPHLKERGFFEELTHPEAGTHLYPGIQG